MICCSFSIIDIVCIRCHMSLSNTSLLSPCYSNYYHLFFVIPFLIRENVFATDDLIFLSQCGFYSNGVNYGLEPNYAMFLRFWVIWCFLSDMVLPLNWGQGLLCSALSKFKNKMGNVDDLVRDCSNSIANVLELLQSCTKPSTWWIRYGQTEFLKLCF